MKREFIKKTLIVAIFTFMITNVSSLSASAQWIKDKDDNWTWINNYKKAIGWNQIENKWYYFDSNGIMQTQWINPDGNWYYLSTNGQMSIGWNKISGKWYYFNPDGKMSIGWIQDNNNWYYTNSDGEMESGTIKIDGQTYQFNDDGKLISNNIEETNDDGEKDSSTNSENDVNSRNDDGFKTAYVATNSYLLNVRSDPSMYSDIISTVTKGSKLQIIGDEKNQFYPIILNGKTGWVSSDWISFDEPQENNSSNQYEQKEESKPMSTPVVNNNNIKFGDIRLTAPSKDSKYYYSDDNIFYKVKLSPPFYSGGKPIIGNCTWYAWGRAWEMTGIRPIDAGLIGNAYEWWSENQESGKYQYGSQPRVGAIAVWKSNMPNSGGSGHVAIVEKIDGDKVYISESAWNGLEFGYREIYETNYLYGYIYLDKPNY